MKKIIFVAIIVFICSCDPLAVDSLYFDASVETDTYKVGEEVTFNFHGNPDYLLFYSGENGYNYQNSNRTNELGRATAQFSSLITGNTNAEVRLLVSSDFNGVYDRENIDLANWIDITGDVALSSGTQVLSERVDLTKYYNEDNHFYFLIKCKKNEDEENKVFSVKFDKLSILNSLADGSEHNINPANNFTGWRNIDILNPSILWTVNTSGHLEIKSTTENHNSANEDWCISSPFYLNRVVPDRGKTVKSMLDESVDSYSRVFNKAGRYVVTFVASNHSIKDVNTVVKKIEITINE